MGLGRFVIVNGLLISFSAQAFAGFTPQITAERVASGLSFPTTVTHAPGDFDRLYILEKRGIIKVMDLDTEVVTTFMNIDGLVGGGTSQGDERGLLGMAFHPDYQNNGFFYIYYTDNGSDTIVARYSIEPGNPDLGDAGSASQLLFINQPQTNHNGGWMGFSPLDDYLYIGTGDGGGACDQHGPIGNSQDITSNLLGKMLRIDVDGNDGPGGAYGIPADNPFVGITGDDEIWSYGLRNPWRCSFDRENGDLYIGDVGQNQREEIDYQRGDAAGGANYGWRCMEGNSCSTISFQCNGLNMSGCTCGAASLIDPIHEYNHSQGCSIVGGYVYRGCAINGMQGTYFLADTCGSNMWTFQYDGMNLTNFETKSLSSLNPLLSTVVAFGEDAYGELYVVDHGSSLAGNGEVFKILSSSALDPANDCNENLVHDDCEILDGSEPDDNMNGIPDSCKIPPCTTLADCADTDDNGIRDDACTVYECVAGECIESARVTQGDMTGGNGACEKDDACDANDSFSALNCFSDQTTLGTPGYPCDESPPAALVTDAGGEFGSCVLDGFCDANDSFAALNCFSDVNTSGDPGYPCGCSGPMPDHSAAQQPDAVAHASLALRAPRSVGAGDEVEVHVYFDNAVKDLRGYQLHLGVSGGLSGRLELRDISIQQGRGKHAFDGQGYWSAFNASTAQMTAGLNTMGVPVPAGSYLATYTYHVPEDATGTFTIDVLYDDHNPRPEERTFLFASPLRKIGVTSTTAAQLIVANKRGRRASR